MMKERTNCSGNSQVPWPQGLARVQERQSAPICACAVWWAAGCWAARAGCLGWATVTAEQHLAYIMARYQRCAAVASLAHMICLHSASNALQIRRVAVAQLTLAVQASGTAGLSCPQLGRQ